LALYEKPFRQQEIADHRIVRSATFPKWFDSQKLMNLTVGEAKYNLTRKRSQKNPPEAKSQS
jgi:hypothetical protein